MYSEIAGNVEDIKARGYTLIPRWLTSKTNAQLCQICDKLLTAQHGPGIRSPLLRSEELRSLVQLSDVRLMAVTVIGAGAFITRSILFDKSPTTNWDVSWHQDTAIAVRERRDAPDFGPWSVKNGVPHVRPPSIVLEHMVTIRIH